MSKQSERLRELVSELYKESGLEVTPMYPKILVRVLPREQVSKGGIILTEHQQNKPTLEGIVLKTFEPFWKVIAKETKDKVTTKSSEFIAATVEVGQHVLFPHIDYGITPVWPLDDGRGDYRLVPEEKIVARLDYSQRPIKDEILELIGTASGKLDWKSFDNNVSDFLNHFDVVRKNIVSKTVSGA